MNTFTPNQLHEIGFELIATGQACGINYATAIDPLSGIEFLLLSSERNSTWFSRELCNKKKLNSSRKQQLITLAIQKLNTLVIHTRSGPKRRDFTLDLNS
jgi:hypothetical protein